MYYLLQRFVYEPQTEYMFHEVVFVVYLYEEVCLYLFRCGTVLTAIDDFLGLQLMDGLVYIHLFHLGKHVCPTNQEALLLIWG